jgi:ABC-2 type transport system permease protein
MFANPALRRRLRLVRRQSDGSPRAWPLRGPGSVFAKTLRDSRRAILLAGIGIGLTALSIGVSTAVNYPTVESRHQQLLGLQQSPAFGSLFGLPIGTDSLGGLVCWRDGMFAAILLAMWSISALSGALAAEARSGALEIVAGLPMSRRRIALEKLAAHVAGMALAVVVIAAMTWLTGLFYAVLPGDSMAFTDALAYFGGLALVALCGGSLAFALSSLLGRGAAAGIAAAVFFLAYVAYVYADLVPALGTVTSASPFTWTAHHQPLAGSWDTLSLLPVAALALTLMAAGVVAFERQDLGATKRLPHPALPGRSFLLRGPARQAFLRSRTAALSCGLGLGGLLALFAAGSRSLAATATSDPGSEAFVRAVFGDADWTSARGLLQLAFTWFGYLILALIAAVLVSGVASDERQRRLGLVLSTPLSRARWLAASAVGLFAALALMTLTIALLTGLGTAAGGQDPIGPAMGVWVGGLYAATLASLGLAALGLGFADLAAVIPAGVALGLYFWDIVGSIFRAPPALTSLSLTHHLGRPLAGEFDWPGMALLAGLALAALAVGAWGIHRRDLAG